MKPSLDDIASLTRESCITTLGFTPTVNEALIKLFGRTVGEVVDKLNCEKLAEEANVGEKRLHQVVGRLHDYCKHLATTSPNLSGAKKSRTILPKNTLKELGLKKVGSHTYQDQQGQILVGIDRTEISSDSTLYEVLDDKALDNPFTDLGFRPEAEAALKRGELRMEIYDDEDINPETKDKCPVAKIGKLSTIRDIINFDYHTLRMFKRIGEVRANDILEQMVDGLAHLEELGVIKKLHNPVGIKRSGYYADARFDSGDSNSALPEEIDDKAETTKSVVTQHNGEIPISDWVSPLKPDNGNPSSEDSPGNPVKDKTQRNFERNREKRLRKAAEEFRDICYKIYHGHYSEEDADNALDDVMHRRGIDFTNIDELIAFDKLVYPSVADVPRDKVIYFNHIGDSFGYYEGRYFKVTNFYGANLLRPLRRGDEIPKLSKSKRERLGIEPPPLGDEPDNKV